MEKPLTPVFYLTDRHVLGYSLLLAENMIAVHEGEP
jgi:hypothetical protein